MYTRYIRLIVDSLLGWPPDKREMVSYQYLDANHTSMRFKSREELKIYMSCLDAQEKCLRVCHEKQRITFECTYPRCPFILRGKEPNEEGAVFVCIHQYVPHDHRVDGGVPEGVDVALFRKVYLLRENCHHDQIILDALNKAIRESTLEEYEVLKVKKKAVVQRSKYRVKNLEKSERELQYAIANPTPPTIPEVTVDVDAIHRQAEKDRGKYDALLQGLNQPPPDAPHFGLPDHTDTMPAYRKLNPSVIVWNIDLNAARNSDELRNQAKNTRIAYESLVNGEPNPTRINLDEELYDNRESSIVDTFILLLIVFSFVVLLDFINMSTMPN